jgi:hypothetical protein
MDSPRVKGGGILDLKVCIKAQRLVPALSVHDRNLVARRASRAWFRVRLSVSSRSAILATDNPIGLASIVRITRSWHAECSPRIQIPRF